VTLDWSRGALVATGVGPADRNAPSPTVARVARGPGGGARRARRSRRRWRQVPTSGAGFDPRAPAIARELALAPVVAVDPRHRRLGQGDGRARARGVAAGRAGPRPVAGDDGPLVVTYVDARARLAVTPTVGLPVIHAGVRWTGPTRFVAAVPAGVAPMIATAVSADGLAVPAAVAGSAAVVVVVPPEP
jgi:hypothetical protein